MFFLNGVFAIEQCKRPIEFNLVHMNTIGDNVDIFSTRQKFYFIYLLLKKHNNSISKCKWMGSKHIFTTFWKYLRHVSWKNILMKIIAPICLFKVKHICPIFSVILATLIILVVKFLFRFPFRVGARSRVATGDGPLENPYYCDIRWPKC